MKQELLKKISDYKKIKQIDGFILLGVFGSFARNEERNDSDIDILFELNEQFLVQYPGWQAYSKLEEIREELENLLKYPVDLADKDALGKIAQKYILPEVVYVS